MVKRCYIQGYPEKFRGNSEARTIASDFIWPSMESSLTRQEKKRTSDMVRLVAGNNQSINQCISRKDSDCSIYRYI